MCLYKTHRFPKRAKEDILVYKKLLRKYDYDRKTYVYTTPYRDVPVNLNTTIKSSKSPLFGIFKEAINAEGVHAFINASRAMYSIWSDSIINVVIIVKAYIPKGTLYYIGDHGDIASGELYITDMKIEPPYIENVQIFNSAPNKHMNRKLGLKTLRARRMKRKYRKNK